MSFLKKKKNRIGLVWIITIVIILFILLHNNPLADQQTEWIKKSIVSVILLISCTVFSLLYDKIIVLPWELYHNRKLIWKLAKNDFKKKYAGSYLGAVWGLTGPVVTVVMYSIIFGGGMIDRGELLGVHKTVPYVLHLTAGMVPWFYFSESLSQATTAFMEYSYLVKKVVFKISILPIIKIVGAVFVHVFFITILLIMACFYGFYPTAYTLQVIYYSFCTFCLVLAISYTTCSVVVFFRDLQQIIGIILQVGIWATPIMWDLSVFPEKLQVLIKLNPLVYVVKGYRDAVFSRSWFFEDFFSTVYFWVFTGVVFGIGALIYKRLKIHFADVL